MIIMVSNVHGRLKGTLTVLITAYLVLLTVVYYFFKNHPQSGQLSAETVYICYAGAIGLFLVLYFFITLLKFEKKEEDMFVLFFESSYVFIGIAILILGLVETGWVITTISTYLAIMLIGLALFYPVIVCILFMLYHIFKYFLNNRRLKQTNKTGESYKKSTEKKMKNIDKITWGELLIIVGGFILAETVIKSFLNLAAGKIEPWVLPAFAIAVIIGGVELKNGVVKSFGAWVYDGFIAAAIILIVFVKSSIITNLTFAWWILTLSIISIVVWVIQWIFLRKNN